MLVNRKLLRTAIDQGFPLALFVNRGTGRTTARILEGIASAIRKPGEWIDVQHHDGEPLNHGVREHTAHAVRDTIERLGLDKMEVRNNGISVQVKSSFAESLF